MLRFKSRFIQLPVIKDFLDVGEGVARGEIGIGIIQVLRNCSVGVVGWREEFFRKQVLERFNLKVITVISLDQLLAVRT